MTPDETIIRGRKRIAFELGRSEKTISRWHRRGILPAWNDGPHENNMLCIRRSDLERIKTAPEIENN